MNARIYDMNNSLIAEAKAVYKKEDETVYISGDRNTADKLVERGDAYRVHYTDSTQGIFDFQCAYGGFEQEGSLFVAALKITETLKSVQRRQDLKLRTNLPIKITLLDIDNKIQIDPVTMRSLQLPGVLRDISAGGIMVDMEEPLEVNQKIMFPFDKGSSPIMVQAEVLREQASTATYHRYGCRFINNNSGKESVIREYVFRLESARKHSS